jgi:CDP-glucose 4,6-dehydratase
MDCKNTLILGASGFIGRNLAARLIGQECCEGKIVLLTHYEDSLSCLQTNDDVIIIKGDIADYQKLCNVISKYDIDTIYHLASNSIVRKCANDPMSAYMTNVMGTVSVLEAVRNVGMNTVKKVLVSTSDKVYGHAPHPYVESTPFEPRYTYESTKACQDIVAQNYFYNYGVPVNIVRCSNVYGLYDSNTSRLIPNVIKCINNKENPKVHSGVANFIREFVYVEDVIDAMLLIREMADIGQIYCVGGTEKISIIDLVHKISELMQHVGGVDIIQKPANFQEIAEQSIDSSKLKALGWQPKHNLDEGLKKCINSGIYV